MPPSARVLAFALALGLAAAVTATASFARADERVECASAYERTQREQQKLELIAALDAAERCARPSCPALLSDDCHRWVVGVRRKLPSLVVRVHAADGCPRDAARIDVGGMARKNADEGALYLDPGPHEVTVTDPVSMQTKTQTIDFAPGERRDIDVDFAPADAVCRPNRALPPPPPASSMDPRRFSRTTLVLGSVGGGLVAVGATLGIIGATLRGGLADCKPNCSSDRIDGVRPFLVAGDVVAGIGLLALGAAVVSYFAFDRAEPAIILR